MYLEGIEFLFYTPTRREGAILHVRLSVCPSVHTVGPKMNFYLFGIAAWLAEKLAAQIILFAFQTKKNS
jgi:hypothetical protein